MVVGWGLFENTRAVVGAGQHTCEHARVNHRVARLHEARKVAIINMSSAIQNPLLEVAAVGEVLAA
jgi:hypothetical protein